MGVSFEIEREHGILRVAVDGRLDDAGLTALYRTVGETFARSGARAALLDLGGVTDFAVSSAVIEQLSRANTALPGTQTPRFIVAPQTHVYGAMRRFQLIGEPTRPRLLVVRSAQEVYDMLEISAPKFEPLEK